MIAKIGKLTEKDIDDIRFCVFDQVEKLNQNKTFIKHYEQYQDKNGFPQLSLQVKQSFPHLYI